MPNFVPCRPSIDNDIHLYAGEDARRTLCGKPAGTPVIQPGNAPVCKDCARQLLRLMFAEAGPDGIGSIEVNVHPPTG